jgi:hypothetical protein
VVLLLLVAGGDNPLRAESTAENPWIVLKPYTSSDSDSPLLSGMERIAPLTDAIGKALFRRRADTTLKRFLNEYHHSFSTLDFSGLYSLEDVPWKRSEKGAKQLFFHGIEQDSFYALKESSGLTVPRGPGHSSLAIAINSQKKGYLLRNRRVVNVDHVTERDLYRGIRNYLKLFDLTRIQKKSPTEPLKPHYVRIFRNHLPETVDFLKQYFSVKSIGKVEQTAGTEALAKIDFVVEADPEAFRNTYPEFHRLLINMVQPSGLRINLKDSRGNRILRYERDGLRWRTRYTTRNGRFVPIDPKTGEPAGYTLSPLDVRRSSLRSSLELWMYLYGMRFGTEQFQFRSRYEDGSVTWRMKGRPRVDLPFGFSLVLSPFIDPFLNYLKTGENGVGIRYREGFSRSKSGWVHRVDFRLPLKDSPFVTFLLKLSSMTWQPFDEAARRDMDRFGRNLVERLQRDYVRELNRLRFRNSSAEKSGH